MRAMVMHETGGPQVLQLQDIPKPKIQHANQVLVKVAAAGVNPIDTKLRARGLYIKGGMPAVLGCDGAGVIEAVGDAVTDFRVGDAVYYCYGGLGQKGSGNYAEYTLVDAAYLAEKPQSLSFEEAAAAPLVLITAWESLFDRAHLHAGQTVLINAGAGGVGHVAIQLAKIAGAHVAALVSSAEKARFVKELGADLVLNYKTDSVVERVLDWTDGEGVDVALDVVGGESFSALAPMLRHYANVVTLLQIPDEDVDWKALRLKNVRVSQELMLMPMVYDLQDVAQHHGEILDQCGQFFEAGQLSVYVDEVFPLQDAAKAHAHVGQGHAVGKCVLSMS